MNTSFDENVIPHFAAGMRRRPAASLRTRALRSTSATRRRPATAVCSVSLHRHPTQPSARKTSPPSWFSTSRRTSPSLSPSSTTWICSAPTPSCRLSAQRDTKGGCATRARPAGLGAARPTAPAATGRRGPTTCASVPWCCSSSQPSRSWCAAPLFCVGCVGLAERALADPPWGPQCCRSTQEPVIDHVQARHEPPPASRAAA